MRKKFVVCLESILLGGVIFFLCFLSLPLTKPLFYVALIASIIFSAGLGYYFYTSRMALQEALEVVDEYLAGKQPSFKSKERLTRRLVKDLYSGSIDSFVFALDGNEKISEKERDELLEYVEKF